MFYLFYKLHIFLSKTLLKLKNKSMMDPNYTGLVLRISLRVTEKDAWSKLLCVMDGACEIYVMVNFFMLEAHKLWLVSIWCRYISVGLEDVDLVSVWAPRPLRLRFSSSRFHFFFLARFCWLWETNFTIMNNKCTVHVLCCYCLYIKKY